MAVTYNPQRQAVFTHGDVEIVLEATFARIAAWEAACGGRNWRDLVAELKNGGALVAYAGLRALSAAGFEERAAGALLINALGPAQAAIAEAISVAFPQKKRERRAPGPMTQAPMPTIGDPSPAGL